MILARLTRAFREQNWFAVALEFVIVVVGVLLAFQITLAAEARRDRLDEHEYLERLHSDILVIEERSARVRERRLAVLDSLYSGLEALFSQSERNALTAEECNSIGATATVYLNVLELTAFNELAAAGRLGILRDQGLRASLVELEQLGQSLNHHMLIQSQRMTQLEQVYPDAISRVPRIDGETQEIRHVYQCDLAAMRNNPVFLQTAASNADDFDAFVRDQLRPWSDKLDEVHARLDHVLGVDLSYHEEAISE